MSRENGITDEDLFDVPELPEDEEHGDHEIENDGPPLDAVDEHPEDIDEREGE